jgi:hypothetical protein
VPDLFGGRLAVVRVKGKLITVSEDFIIKKQEI